MDIIGRNSMLITSGSKRVNNLQLTSICKQREKYKKTKQNKLEEPKQKKEKKQILSNVFNIKVVDIICNIVLFYFPVYTPDQCDMVITVTSEFCTALISLY